jgi:hypothetical protein
MENTSANKQKEPPKVEDLVRLPSLATVTLGGIKSHDKRSEYLPGPQVITSVEDAGPVPDDHYELFKAFVPKDLQYTPFITETGDVDLNRLRTRQGGDFSNSSFACYFTPDRETAEQYRRYAQDRCKYAETWIIRILLSKSFIASEQTTIALFARMEGVCLVMLGDDT